MNSIYAQNDDVSGLANAAESVESAPLHQARPGLGARTERFLFEVRSRRSGFTLIELLVATVASLLLVLAVTQAFAVVSEVISANRAEVEMSGQLRGAALRLEQDLDGVTVPMAPWIDSTAAQGYFEYIEGIGSEVGQLTGGPAVSHVGDIDDIVIFTARAAAQPFVGTYDGVTIESDVAEVVWWASEQQDGSFILHRRSLLIKPELNGPDGWLPLRPGFSEMTPQKLIAFYNGSDLSVRPGFDPVSNTIRLTANSLSDLAHRQNRFAHYPISPDQLFDFTSLARFPYEINTVLLRNNLVQHDERVGYDIILPNAVAFDVRAYDAQAPVIVHPGFDGQWGVAGFDDDGDSMEDGISEAGSAGSDDEALTPGDPGWFFDANWRTNPNDSSNPSRVIGTGAYVDLNYLRYYPTLAVPAALSQFSQVPWYLDVNANGFRDIDLSRPADQDLDVGLRMPTYDTWPFDLERNGLNNDFPQEQSNGLPLLTDEGIDGIDNDNFNGVDDLGERETQPPYSTKLRGIQVRLRVFDPATRQVRQQTVRADFTLE